MANVAQLDFTITEMNSYLRKLSVLPEHSLAGKKIVNLGDSIFGLARAPEDISTSLSKFTGATVYNCAFGGTHMTNHPSAAFNPFCMCNLATAIATGNFSAQDAQVNDSALQSYYPEALNLLKSINFSSVDIVTIAFGSNDFTNGDKLSNAQNLYDKDSFEGALRFSIETILTAFPHLKIYLCTPTYRFWITNGTFAYDSDTYVNTSSNLKLPDFVESVKKIGTEYHLPVIDNYNVGINKFTRSTYFSANDGTHHNAAGRELIARNMANKLF